MRQDENVGELSPSDNKTAEFSNGYSSAAHINGDKKWPSIPILDYMRRSSGSGTSLTTDIQRRPSGPETPRSALSSENQSRRPSAFLWHPSLTTASEIADGKEYNSVSHSVLQMHCLLFIVQFGLSTIAVVNEIFNKIVWN